MLCYRLDQPWFSVGIIMIIMIIATNLLLTIRICFKSEFQMYGVYIIYQNRDSPYVYLCLYL